MLPDGIKRAFRLRRSVADQAARDVDAELRFHLESRIEDLVAQGLDPAAATEQAVREFGDVARARRVLARESRAVERAGRLSRWWTDLFQDVRLGWRKLRAQPGFASVAVLTLALGIGANTAVFGVVHAVLLRPLPYAQPDRLVAIWEVSPTGDDHNVVSRGNFMDWRDQAGAFGSLGAYGGGSDVTLWSGGDDPLRLSFASVTPGVFETLGVEALVGRTFTAEEGLPGAPLVAVLGHGLWQSRFGADPDMVGRTVELDESTVEVVGVMPPDFDFPRAGVQLWIPWSLGESDRQNRRSHNLRVVGRLADGVSVEQAQAEMSALAAGIAELHPEFMEGWGVNVQPYRADLTASTRPLLLMLAGVSGLVLLLACANLANLLLARALAREGEVAIRGALGAGRGRLIRQMLTEAGLIAVLGGAVGIGVTAAGMDVFLAMAPGDIPLLDDVRVDGAVLAFGFAASLVAALLFGLLPALRITGSGSDVRLRLGGSRGGTGVGHGSVVGLKSGLLVAQVALAVVLLVGAGLLLRSAQRLASQDFGLEPEGVVTLELDLPSSRYDGTPAHVAFYGDLLERVEALPGVESAAGSTDLPAGFGSMTFSFAIEGRPRPGPNPRQDPQPLRIVTPEYFSTLEIPVLEGRAFDSRDDADASPVLMVNQSLARLHWPDDGPVGKRIRFREDGPWLEIVGVVGDTRHYAVDAEPGPALYMPHDQKLWDWTSWLNLLVRVRGEEMALAPSLRETVRTMDSRLGLGRIAPLEELYAGTNARRRFATTLLGAFAVLALILGSVGVYGVLSWSVAQRTRELGVRMALGAPRREVALRVIGRGAGLALAGAVLGSGFAALLTGFLDSLIYGVSGTDPVTFVGVPVVLLAVAVVAAALPALRATRVDPVEALRAE